MCWALGAGLGAGARALEILSKLLSLLPLTLSNPVWFFYHQDRDNLPIPRRRGKAWLDSQAGEEREVKRQPLPAPAAWH